jgi:anti-sigma factor (TIGR02949 family)
MSTPKKMPQLLQVKENGNYVQECKNRKECLKALQLILDDQASVEQVEHFKQNIDKCLPCIENYNLEITVRQMLCDKIQKKEVPTDLIDSIKAKITETV